MSLDQLRELASKDAELTCLVNNAQTIEQLEHIAKNRGITLDLESIDEPISDQDLASVTGGMRGLSKGGVNIKSFGFSASADGAHTCATRASDNCCSACGAHTCSTSNCNECNSCDNSFAGGTKINFF